MTTKEETAEAPEAPTFDALDLTTAVRSALDEIGYTHPTPVQLAAYGPAIEGKDIIVQARTGTGKTAAFAIPMVDRIISEEPGVQALVLAPTRELALQSSRELERIGKNRDLRTVAVYGGAAMGPQIDALEGGAQIVSGTPGRVLDHLRRGTLDPDKIKLLVLDEMDEMLSMGFAKELNAILELIPPRDKRQTMCFSATVDDSIKRHAERHMRDPEVISLSSDAVGAEQISHYVYMVTGKDRVGDLIQILENEDPESAIIFCNLRVETEQVASALQQAGFNADWLNGDLPQSEREKVMRRTREGKLRFLVATDVAARGIDISHLTHVINYSFPESTAVYVHRTGRTGRAGRTGCAISLVGPQELGRLYYLRLEYKIFPVERSLPSAGERRTRAEADRVALLDEAFPTARPADLTLARRLLTHPEAERIVGGLLQAFFGSQGDEETDEQAAAARRSREPRPVEEEEPEPRARERRSRGRDDDRGRRRGRDRDRDRSPEAEQSSDRDADRQERGGEERGGRRRSRRGDRDSDAPEASGDGDDREERDSGPPPALLYLAVGRKDGVRVGEVARLVRESCDLKRSEVGRIRLRDRYTHVEVPDDRLDDIVEQLKDETLHDKELAPERARSARS
ncbi:MAG: DEAD/DEAH box helicase [Myxococcales bacterium]|jgi:ATP-dependent RNA helicase DeaD